LFEARRPKRNAIISEIDGVVRLTEEKKNRVIIVTNNETADERKYNIPFGYRVTVLDGDVIKAGDMITEGAICPSDILNVKGPDGVQNYIIKEIQSVYRLQGVDINDKHIEVIVRQMMRKLKVTDAGSTNLIPNALTDKEEVLIANKQIEDRIAAGETGLQTATYEPTLLGITKASLATESFLSAASFQETTRVLTDAAIKGKVDPLFGLKENVIIGKLVPAGTGTKCYNLCNETSDNVSENTVEDVVEAQESEIIA
ncbi:MAG: DNA-directed RNA polymerase subunit beta', partial [bacterium]|nr:DNA-directed RNA polymerase subunit beta' [bacterium]